MKTNINQEKVWNRVSKAWDRHRQKPWKDVEEMMNFLIHQQASKHSMQLPDSKHSMQLSGRILDIGCGNCRNLLDFAKQGFECYGIDFSEEMLKHADEFAKKNNIKIKLKKARAENLPFNDNSFDYVLCVAVLHHLRKKEQIKALKEILRALKPEGRALITVWNNLNPKFWKFLLKKETFIPWKINDKTYQRYYYFFSFYKLRSLLKKAGFKVVKQSSPFARNLIFIVKKPVVVRKNY